MTSSEDLLGALLCKLELHSTKRVAEFSDGAYVEKCERQCGYSEVYEP
jgi:hypothetical protein